MGLGTTSQFKFKVLSFVTMGAVRKEPLIGFITWHSANPNPRLALFDPLS